MTKRSPIALIALVLAGMCSLTASAAEPSGLHLRPTGGASFPERAYVLSLPENAYLSPESVVVRENGKVVKDTTVVPASEADASEFGVVLVIDASNSMRGPAIEGATAAAQALVSQRAPGQAIGVVSFNARPTVRLPLTTDEAAIDSALAAPPELRPKTHVYDAVSEAVSMLEDADVAVKSIVVLSDGADTGSVKSLDEVATEARDAGVRVFTVGLRSQAFDPVALRELGGRGGGQYAEAATPADLEPIFGELGAKLASEYLIRYRSDARAARRVVVSVTVAGYPGAVTAGYTTPSVERTGEPFDRTALERLVRSSVGMVGIALLIAGLISLSVFILARPRGQGVRKRLAEFVSLAETEQRSEERTKELFLERAEKSFQGATWWARFKQELDVGRIRMPAIRIVAWTVLATLVAMYLLGLVAGPLAALVGLTVPLIVRSAVRRRAERQRQLFAEQLPDNLQVLASALRAGHSLVGALSVVVDDAPEPSRQEFQRLVADEQLGVPLDQSFEVIARRMQSKDVKQVGLVSALQLETGGNTAEVLDRVADTVRERFELRRLVKTLTAQGRLTRWILSGLPVFLIIVINLLNPEYMTPMYEHPIGRLLLLIAALMVVAGSLVIRRIINIRV
jgi:tight adherence protein B